MADDIIKKLNAKERQILKAFTEDRISFEELMAKTGLKPRQLAKSLKRLERLGLLKEISS